MNETACQVKLEDFLRSWIGVNRLGGEPLLESFRLDVSRQLSPAEITEKLQAYYCLWGMQVISPRDGFYRVAAGEVVVLFISVTEVIDQDNIWLLVSVNHARSHPC